MRRIFLTVLALTALALSVMIVPSGAVTKIPDGPLFAVLLGENEIPPADPDGRGAANVIIHEGSQLCFGLSVTGIDSPVAAHVHRGTKHENGPVVVPLTPPSSGDPGASSGCVAAASELLAEILTKPADFYVNVHSAAFPGGAVRGQLFRETH